MTDNYYIDVVEYLRYLGDGGMPETSIFGICNNVDNKFGSGTHYLFVKYYEGWDLFSGDELFPVSHPSETAYQAYFNSSSDENWTTGEYARRRRDLCKYLADCIERDYC